VTTPSATPTPPFPEHRRSRLGTALDLRRNPLWRPSDSLRSRLRVLLVIGLLASVGLSTGFAALARYRDDRAAELRRDAHLHSVQAVILTAPGRAPANDPAAGATAQVRWDGQGGTVHQATLAVPESAAVGARIQLWLDSTGKVGAAPVTAEASAAWAAFLDSGPAGRPPPAWSPALRRRRRGGPGQGDGCRRAGAPAGGSDSRLPVVEESAGDRRATTDRPYPSS
jgi:hypothetical protein